MKTFTLLTVLLFTGFTTVLAGCNGEDNNTKPYRASTTDPVNNYTELTITSGDGLPVTGYYYETTSPKHVILLCHQARFNKYEYAATAPALQARGYTCLAIDQRSGGPIVDHTNQTWLAARGKGLPTDYLDAEQDIIAAIDWLYEKTGQKVILWGSSYSATLALYIGMNNDKVMASISFSPGNYFSAEKGDLKKLMPAYDKPWFITSSKEEAGYMKAFMADLPFNEKHQWFIPEAEGAHGSRVLWPTQPFANEYWKAVWRFLEALDH